MTLSSSASLIVAGLAAAAAVGCGTKSNGTATGAAGAGGGGGDVGAGDAAAGTGGTTPADASADAPQPLPFTASYHMGADITWVQHDEYYGATYVDTDGVTKDPLELLKNHGFNSIRLRAYVDPRAADGYDQYSGFGDLDHTVTMAQRIRKAGMGFYLAFHYSDNWADPGKQCVPVSWQALTTIEALASAVHDYTFNFLSALQAVDALPEFVQVGNEITSGMLVNVCDSMGTPTGTNPVNGHISNWPNLAALLKAGIAAVREVNPNIKTVLHLDRAASADVSASFINNAMAQMVSFDVFAESTYVYWHGQPSGWQKTFTTLADMFPNLSFVVPEYGNETATDPSLTSTTWFVNDMVFNLPNNRGLGAWIYEPEHPFQAGPFAGKSLGIGLFDGVHGDGGEVTGDSWPSFPALPGAMGTYDALRSLYAPRL